MQVVAALQRGQNFDGCSGSRTAASKSTTASNALLVRIHVFTA
jgi:hypothetical protein